MKDLSSTSFCVPVLEGYSPIAYTIVMDVHWNHPNATYAGIETTHGFVLQRVYIIEKNNFKESRRFEILARDRCRYLLKRKIDIAIGSCEELQHHYSTSILLFKIRSVWTLLLLITSAQTNNCEDLGNRVLLLFNICSKLQSL